MDQPLQRHRQTNRAAIWDMDGVIADTAHLHFKAWQRLMSELGRSLSYQEFLPTFGRRNPETISQLLPGRFSPQQIEQLSDRKERFFREQIGAGFQPLPGVRTLAQSLRISGYRQAVASSAPRKNIGLILRTLQLETCFSVVVAGEDTDRGKPDPRVFLIAAERLGVTPARSVVIEDSMAGVQAAKSAGMAVIAVTNSWSREALRAADAVVDSLEEVDVRLIESLLHDLPSPGLENQT